MEGQYASFKGFAKQDKFLPLPHHSIFAHFTVGEERTAIIPDDNTCQLLCEVTAHCVFLQQVARASHRASVAMPCRPAEVLLKIHWGGGRGPRLTLQDFCGESSGRCEDKAAVANWRVKDDQLDKT